MSKYLFVMVMLTEMPTGHIMYQMFPITVDVINHTIAIPRRGSSIMCCSFILLNLSWDILTNKLKFTNCKQKFFFGDLIYFYHL